MSIGRAVILAAIGVVCCWIGARAWQLAVPSPAPTGEREASPPVEPSPAASSIDSILNELRTSPPHSRSRVVFRPGRHRSFAMCYGAW